MRKPAGALIAFCTGLAIASSALAAEVAEPERLAFAAVAEEFHFDTGLQRGALRRDGKSLGLGPVVDVASGTQVAGRYGLLSHYRLLDAEARYGHAAWDWPSTAKLLEDGAVEVRWAADPGHPFDMAAVYRWKGPGTLDVETSVMPRGALRRFEVFLASYFAGFAETRAYVAACPETGGKAAFLEATAPSGHWQTFPRDEQAVKIFGDGRWRRPPNPVDWKMRPRLAAPLAMRRDAERNLTALLMAPPADCFAVSMPHSGEGHRSVYLSLFGRDLAPGRTATARARLIVGRGISDEQAVELYRAYVEEQPPP